ncbi:hypothetical protein [Actinomadura livida]|uniref:Type IV secretion system protein n=1 Tax=Actinomadura livida TaxID=79909 RepID=A0A7W7MVJ2_9ACTN|nr:MULTISPECIES: hypothetical protein [Actinomadura]MBB4771935.1 hypothetical protein [Actinomadura catellatispora]GGU03514.1 hypothetical protein GCM10010208_29580 [Actinomadura livida]
MLPLDPCSPLTDPACLQPVDNDDGENTLVPPPPDIPGAIGGRMLDEAAESFQAAVGWLISKTASWWVETPSPDLQEESAIGHLQLLVQPLTVAVAVMGLLVVAAKMALTHKANPLIDLGRGLAVLAAVTTIGVVVPNLLLQWGDQWCDWVLSATSQGDFAQRMTKIVTFPSGTPAALVLLLCMFALVIGVLQAILLLFRAGALIILAGLLPLAAAGMMTAATKTWFARVAGWMLALIFYKPAAAAVYATAFTLVGEGQSLHALLMGLTMMLISLVAFPVLLKFFTWTTGGTESVSGGGMLGTLMSSAAALGALRAYGSGGSGGESGDGQSSSASEHTSYLKQQLGDQDTSPAGDSADPAPTPPGSPDRHSPASDTGDHASAPGAPSGSEQPGATSSGTDQNPEGGHGWAPPDGGQGEPVGPALIRTADKERQRGEDMVRWAATGSTGGSSGGGAGGPGGGPTGAVGEGGTGGGK